MVCICVRDTVTSRIKREREKEVCEMCLSDSTTTMGCEKEKWLAVITYHTKTCFISKKHTSVERIHISIRILGLHPETAIIITHTYQSFSLKSILSIQPGMSIWLEIILLYMEMFYFISLTWLFHDGNVQRLWTFWLLVHISLRVADTNNWGQRQ